MSSSYSAFSPRSSEYRRWMVQMMTFADLSMSLERRTWVPYRSPKRRPSSGLTKLQELALSLVTQRDASTRNRTRVALPKFSSR
jgi:hypothetical protein